MFWWQFVWQFGHFAIHILAGLVLLSVFWLYLDTWWERKPQREVPKLMGYLLLALSFMLQGTVVESNLISADLFLGAPLGGVILVTRLLGYISLLAGLVVDPLERRPAMEGLSRRQVGAVVVPGLGLTIGSALQGLWPVLAGAAALLYWRRGTVGLERHIRPVAGGFALLAVSEFLGLARWFRDSDSIGVYELVGPFRTMWVMEQVVLVVAVVWLGRWVWQYLVKRIMSQLLMIMVAGIVAVFLVTTMVFSVILVKNFQADALTGLTTDVKVMELALNSELSGMIAEAQTLALEQQVVGLIRENRQLAMHDWAEEQVVAGGYQTLMVTSSQGQVLSRGEDRERVGMSVSNTPVVAKAISGAAVGSVQVSEGIVAPQVMLMAAAPVTGDAGVIGVVAVGRLVDEAFVDEIKASTGLEVAVYGGKTVAAATLKTGTGKERWMGMEVSDVAIVERVLGNGEEYSGSVTLMGVPYYGAYVPLADVDEEVVGMLFVGKPQFAVLSAAGQAVEATFIAVALLIVLSIAPAGWVARYVSYQVS